MFVVGMLGFEPRAFATRGRRAAVLRYIPKYVALKCEPILPPNFAKILQFRVIILLTRSATRGRRAAVLRYIPLSHQTTAVFPNNLPHLTAIKAWCRWPSAPGFYEYHCA